MKQLDLKDVSNALVITAHPDDETIWLGGTMKKYPKINWAVFSLCRASDADRAPKFKKVCKAYNAKGIITDLEDEGKMNIKKTIPLIKKLLEKNLKEKKFDCVFTHGTNGEYGHPRHKGVHSAVLELWRAKKIKAKKLFCFNYELVKNPKNKTPLTVAKKNSEFFLSLSAKEFQAKKKIMSELYGFDANGIDANYCANPEGFILIK